MSVNYFKRSFFVAMSLALLINTPVSAFSNKPSLFNGDPSSQSSENRDPYPYPEKCTYEEAVKQIEAAGLAIIHPITYTFIKIGIGCLGVFVGILFSGVITCCHKQHCDLGFCCL